MTQKELIDKWRKEAEELKENVRWSYDDREWSRAYAKAEAYTECADDLEALTY